MWVFLMYNSCIYLKFVGYSSKHSVYILLLSLQFILPLFGNVVSKVQIYGKQNKSSEKYVTSKKYGKFVSQRVLLRIHTNCLRTFLFYKKYRHNKTCLHLSCLRGHCNSYKYALDQTSGNVVLYSVLKAQSKVVFIQILTALSGLVKTLTPEVILNLFFFSPEVKPWENRLLQGSPRES